MTSALLSPERTRPAFVRDYTDFRARLEALPNIAHAMSTGLILPISDDEIRQTFLACVDTITETAPQYETEWAAHNPGADAISIDPALFQEIFGIDLVKALWAGQFPRKFDSGDILDVSRLSDDELANLFNRKPQ